VTAWRGPIGTALATGEVSVSQSLVRLLAAQPKTSWLVPPDDTDPAFAGMSGPGAAARFSGETLGAGIVTIVRAPGGAPFTDTEVTMLADLTGQLALSIELGRARVDTERLAVLEDRHRIARDLHDTVIQDLIGLGMQLNVARRRQPDPVVAEQDAEVVDRLDHAVRQLRAVVLELRDRPTGRTFTQTLQYLVDDARRALGHRPTLVVDGPIDVLDAAFAAEVSAVLTESLSNVARHARATRTTVRVSFNGDVFRLEVDDDGVGAAPGSGREAGHGLENLAHRAKALGGEATLEPQDGGGSRLTWWCLVTL
jgi:signal transduction histidine kinase